jgi:AraC-like DNA-binding protein
METYPLADHTQEVTAPRTRLYNLQPIGTGTALIESLTSYIARLADAHRVALAKFVAHEIASHLVPQDASEALSYMGGSFDGVSASAGRVISLAETATGRKNMEAMTMRPWSNIFSPLELLRREEAWCPNCLIDWKANHRPAYAPLLWKLKVVTVCPIHERPLVDACPNCGKQWRVRDWISTPGYCPKCKVCFAEGGNTLRAFGKGEVKEWDLFAAKSACEIINKSSQLCKSPERNIFSENISFLIERAASGSVHRFTKLVQAGHDSTFRGWRDGKTAPQLPRFLLVCYRFGITPLKLLFDKLSNDLSPTLLSINYNLNREVLKRLRKHNFPQLQQRLEQIIGSNDFPPPSLAAVSRQLGYSLSGLSRSFPQLSKAISERYWTYVRKRKLRRRVEIEENLTAVIRALHVAGEVATASKISARLQKPNWLMEPWIREECARILKNLEILKTNDQR